MPGPPPKKPGERRRRNKTLPMVQLPAGGRRGDPPDWPLPTSNAAEREVWAQVWTTPQAAQWERLGWSRVVARYVRALVVAEKRNAPSTVLAEVRQLEDRLGLTPMSMLRLRWEVTADEVAQRRARSSSDAEAKKRRRKMAVDTRALARP